LGLFTGSPRGSLLLVATALGTVLLLPVVLPILPADDFAWLTSSELRPRTRSDDLNGDLGTARDPQPYSLGTLPSCPAPGGQLP
jgi:hypothetical protein